MQCGATTQAVFWCLEKEHQRMTYDLLMLQILGIIAVCNRKQVQAQYTAAKCFMQYNGFRLAPYALL